MKNQVSSLVALIFFSSLIASAQTGKLKIIDTFIGNNEIEKAFQWIDTELQKNNDDENTVILQNKKAELLIGQGRLEEAESIIEMLNKRTLPPFLKAISLANAGNLEMNKGRYDRALEFQQNALTFFQTSNNQNTREAAQCLANLAIIYTSTGKFNQAEENGLIALQIRQKLFGETSEETAASYNDLGLVYTQNDPDKALEYYEKALPVYESLHGKQHPKIAIVNTNMGFIYRQMELYGDAINNLETALKIWKSIYPGGHPNEAFVLSNLGQTYVKMGNAKAGEEYFQKALAIYQKSYNGKHPDISSTLNQIGILKLGQSKFDEAIENFHHAIISNVPNYNQSNLRKNPPIKDFYNGYVLLYSLRLKAQALEAKHFNKTLLLDDLKSALTSLYSSDTLIDNIRHHSTDESDKIALGEQAIEVYEDGVRLAHILSEITLDVKHFREVSFYFAEKSKSAVLQESIADANAKSFAGIPTSLLEEEKKLKSSITLLSQKLSQKPSLEEEKVLRETLFTTNGKYNEFVKRLEKEFPNYYNLKFNQQATAVTKLQKTLDEHKAIISYFIAEKNKRIYQFIITKNKFNVRNLSLPENFDRLAKGFNNSLFYSSIDIFQNSGRELKRLLIPRLPSSINELIIIPTGKLSTLPFEAIPYKVTAKKDFQSTTYVAHRFAISYQFSAGLISAPSEPSAEMPGIFLCAPIRFAESQNLNELPGTEQEVNTIAALFKGSSLIAKQSDANETRIKSGDLKKYNYLHFATHGIVDETNPELSRIFLNASNQEDGNLFAGEIYNLNLNANLTVLSACQTGLGKVSKGEGVIGLSRALIYAGSENLVVSFWSVADESTALLMTDFYKTHLQEKKNFRKALQQAKINMINEGKFSSPYYWAPFVMIGN
jgi:CHAT domain-containing protein/Tfp pilus assembly protein PilF